MILVVLGDVDDDDDEAVGSCCRGITQPFRTELARFLFVCLLGGGEKGVSREATACF